MKIDLMQTLPEYFREILEFKELMKTDQAVLAELEANIEQIRKIFISKQQMSLHWHRKRHCLIYLHLQVKQLNIAGRDYYRNTTRSSRFLSTF